MNIFKKLFSNFKDDEIPVFVFLGDVAVVPRKEYKRILELGWESHETDQCLKNWISEFVSLQTINEITDVPKNAVILEIIISSYQCGSSGVLGIEQVVIPILWRPSIRLCGRLVSIRDNKVIDVYSSVKSMKWKKYVLKTLSFSNLFKSSSSSVGDEFGCLLLHSPFTENDMKYLLGCALLDLLEWSKQKI